MRSGLNRAIGVSILPSTPGGQDRRLRFTLEWEGDASLKRESSVIFENRKIIADARQTAPLCDRDAKTESEAMACYGLGVRLASEGKYAEAIQCLDRKIAFAPEPGAYIERGIAHRKLRKFDKAIKDYDEAIKLQPSNAVAHYDRGNVYRDIGLDHDAIRDYSDAIEIERSMPEPYGNRGVLYIAAEQFELAIENFDDLIAIRPRDRKGYINRGVAYSKIGESYLAIADFSHAIRLVRSQPDAFNNRGIVYFELAQYERALDDYSKAIALDPEYFEPYLGRALTYISLERYAEAERDLNTAIRLSPDSEDALEARAELRRQKGNDTGASLDFKAAWDLCHPAKQ